MISLLAIAVVGLAFAVIVAMFAIQNSTPVSISFFSWQLADISLALVILGSAAAGAFAAGLFAIVREIRLKLSLRACRNRLESATRELDLTRDDNTNLQKEVERLSEEVRATASELEEARKRVSALEIELEATQAMEILPEPQSDGNNEGDY